MRYLYPALAAVVTAFNVCCHSSSRQPVGIDYPFYIGVMDQSSFLNALAEDETLFEGYDAEYLYLSAASSSLGGKPVRDGVAPIELSRLPADAVSRLRSIVGREDIAAFHAFGYIEWLKQTKRSRDLEYLRRFLIERNGARGG